MVVGITTLDVIRANKCGPDRGENPNYINFLRSEGMQAQRPAALLKGLAGDRPWTCHQERPGRRRSF